MTFCQQIFVVFLVRLKISALHCTQKGMEKESKQMHLKKIVIQLAPRSWQLLYLERVTKESMNYNKTNNFT